MSGQKEYSIEDVERLVVEAFKLSYKAGFDDGLGFGKSEIEIANTNKTASSIRMLDYHIEHRARSLAENYLNKSL